MIPKATREYWLFVEIEVPNTYNKGVRHPICECKTGCLGY